MVFTATKQRAWQVRIILIALFISVISTVALARVIGVRAPAEACSVDCYRGVYNTSEQTKFIALTFDDGPSIEATPKILETLAQYEVPATFFLVGERIVEHPELVRAIQDAGHTIGNHTYTSDETRIHESEKRITYELNRTNGLIETITGHSAVLYRPPSLINLEPFEVTPAPGTKPIWDWVYGAGYVPVGVDIDSNDWRVSSADAVVANMRRELTAKETQFYGFDLRVVLLHDLPHTADALPELLTMIDDAGYEVVPLTDLIGMTREQAMPASGVGVGHVANRAVLSGTGVFFPVILVLAFFVMFVAILRIVGFIWFKLSTRRRIREEKLMPRFGGTVSVLIPAYNEAENVRATILSVLGNTRQPDEIIVIDDGSTDTTLQHARMMALEHPGIVRVLTKKNGGKTSALNLGIREAVGDVVVAIDGDTVLDAHCLDTLVRPFASARIGATAGKIIPANTDTLMEKYQYIEYVVGQNIDKEVISSLGSVNIVPGAVGAWRREAIIEVGGYSEDTLVEDQDLTLALLGKNYGVVYVPSAIAYTEVPTSVRSFYLQRFRWTYGTFQCLYKYRSYLMGSTALRLGWISLPYAFTFNIVMPLVALALNVSIILGLIFGSVHIGFWSLAIFTALDMLYALVAFLDEPSAARRRILLIPLQRFAYLAVYSVIMLLVVVKVLDGTPTRWNKLARTGAAQRHFDVGMSSPAAA